MSETEKEDCFYKNLEFGTGGLRAKLGVGTNRLNIYTVRRITAGYANYLLNAYGEEAKRRGVVVARDMRHGSYEFTIEVAKTFAAIGIKTYLFKEITTTPELSFSVPYLNAIGGIVITASHNPPEYNGYKIYDETGCQATFGLANAVITEIGKITDYASIKTVANELITWLDERVDYAFNGVVLSKMVNPEVVRKVGDKFKVLYTPLHGTGRKPVFRVLNEAGFKNVYTVDFQLAPDPEFKTVRSPNPEEPVAFELALKIGQQNEVDLILGTDPDCDRVGALVKTPAGYVNLNGNQLGSLLVYYKMTTSEIVEIKDYSLGIDGLLKSDVLKFFFANGSWVAVRPSGTESKIKFYLGAVDKSKAEVQNNINKLKELIKVG